MIPNSIVFLVDVDDTLIDNDRIQNDLRNHFEREFARENRDRYWVIQEQRSQQAGYRDYLGTRQATAPRIQPMSVTSSGCPSWWTFPSPIGCIPGPSMFSNGSVPGAAVIAANPTPDVMEERVSDLLGFEVLALLATSQSTKNRNPNFPIHEVTT